MGFYGNITNVANTTFQFDKIYSNRVEMTSHCNSDGIMVGRYVLVEYDKEAAYPVIYTNDGKFYSSPNFEENTRIKYLDRVDEKADGFHKDEIGQVQENSSNNQGIITDTKITFYQCNGSDGDYATFIEIDKPSVSDYIANFSIDEAQYGQGKSFKGYDSTVWVKTSEESNNTITTKYVNIANLNSVVPTFDITTDAPTMSPITPHFDANSTNVYYNLHVQPTYGLRVGKSLDKQSDSTTYWTRENYNSNTGESFNEYWDGSQWVKYTGEKEIKQFAGDIYFNKAAFAAQVQKEGTRDKEIDKAVNKEDIISILPTGKSGNLYYDHNTHTMKEANDVQEIKINLPSIGNMMSDAWDIIHGPNRDDARTDENSSLQGRLDSFSYMENNQIPVKRDGDGTFVGTNINGAKQRDVETNTILKEDLHIDDFTQDDAWIRTEIRTLNLVDEDGQQVGNNGIAIHHTYHPDTTNYDVNSNLNIDGVESKQETDKIKLYTPKVDEAGHVVGKSINTVTLPFGYKTIETNGLATNIKTDLNSSTGGSTSADNTQDTLAINTVNKWIQTEVTNDKIELAHEIHNIDTETRETNLNDGTDTITIQDTVYDNAGHVAENRPHTYTLPFGFKNIAVNKASTADGDASTGANVQTATNTQDTLTITPSNKWIGIKGDKDKGIEIGHLIQSDDFGKTYYATNDDIVQADDKNQTPKFGDKVKILNVTVDNAGHITSFGSDTIQMPIGSYEAADFATSHTDIITSISLDNTNGKITSTKANTSTFTLSNYESDVGTLQIQNGSTLNVAFKAVVDYINNKLDLASSNSSGNLVTDVSQTDGKIAVQRKNSGEITLTGYTKPTSSLSNTSIAETETLNNAFGKLEYRLEKEIKERQDAIDTEKTARSNEIATAISAIVDKDNNGQIDKLAEVIEWINNNPSTAVEMQSAINANTAAISDEQTRAEDAENVLSDKINNIVTSLGTAAYANKEAYATAEQGNLAASALQAGTTFNYGTETKTIQELMTIVKDQADTITNLTSRIEALENPNAEQ